MSSNKKPKISLLQLNSRSTQLFLEHSIKIQIKKVFFTRKLFKFVLISNQYLTASQFVTKIVIEEAYDEDGIFSVQFTGKSCRRFLERQKLTFDEILKRQKLLKLKYCQIQYDEKKEKEFEVIWDGFEGAKFGIGFYSDLGPKKSDKELEQNIAIIQNLQNRLYQLDWKIESLIDSRVPSLNLDTFFGYDQPEFSQITELLTKHTIKELMLNFKIDPDSKNFDSFPQCPNLEKLFLVLNENESNKIFDSIMQILTFMPNLKIFKISSLFDYKQNNAKEFERIILESLEKIRKIGRIYSHFRKVKFVGDFSVTFENHEDIFDKIISKVKSTIPYDEKNDIENYIEQQDHTFSHSFKIENYKWRERNIGFKLGLQVTGDRELQEENEENEENY